jgi:hypothetical protein
MNIFRNFMIIGFVILASECSFAQEIWTIGPMLHVNFGGEKRSTSFSIEAAYWNINKFIYSVDFAVEFGRGRMFLYSEAQTGIGVTGISMGPVVEFNFSENATRLGVQGSCWINYIVGVDYRMRFIDHKKLQYIGFYAKLPIATTGLDDDGGGSTSLDDWDDWD